MTNEGNVMSKNCLETTISTNKINVNSDTENNSLENPTRENVVPPLLSSTSSSSGERSDGTNDGGSIYATTECNSIQNDRCFNSSPKVLHLFLRRMTELKDLLIPNEDGSFFPEWLEVAMEFQKTCEDAFFTLINRDLLTQILPFVPKQLKYVHSKLKNMEKMDEVERERFRYLFSIVSLGFLAKLKLISCYISYVSSDCYNNHIAAILNPINQLKNYNSPGDLSTKATHNYDDPLYGNCYVPCDYNQLDIHGISSMNHNDPYLYPNYLSGPFHPGYTNAKISNDFSGQKWGMLPTAKRKYTRRAQKNEATDKVSTPQNEDGEVNVVRKRGRPKGFKNKKTTT